MPIEWGLASSAAGERVVQVGPATSDEVCENLQATRRQHLLGREIIREAELYLGEAGYGLVSAVNTGEQGTSTNKLLYQEEQSLRCPAQALGNP